MEDYYNILGVSENASEEQIKKSFRKLSMKHHPDRGGDKNEFQKINQAYQTIGDPHKREQYNLKKNNPLAHLFGGGENVDMGGLFNMFFPSGGIPFGEEMNQPRVQVFRNGVPMNMPGRNIIRKPPSIIKTVEISIQQAYKGVNLPIEIERWIKEDNTRRVEKEKLYVNIPQGIDDNEIILIKDKGNISSEELRGDIKLYIKVKNNTEFVRNGLDLLLNKKITLKQALLGFVFELDHISGRTYKINNMNGTIIKPFYKKNIPGLGMVRDDSKGFLIISFEIEFPKNLTDEQKEKLEEIL